MSPWFGRRDADWHIERLYDFATGLGATVIRTAISRTVIDVNRDPSGASLYPGQATTGLCPVESFDGHPLYHYASDVDPGDTSGQGVGGVWFVVDGAGNAIEDDASSGVGGYRPASA